MTLQQFIMGIATRFAPVHNIVRQRDQLQAELKAIKKFVPPGHFYSPIPSLQDITNHTAKISGELPRTIPGVNLHEEEQLQVLHALQAYYPDLPFPAHKSKNLRYFFENPFYSYSDAILLYGMIRHVQPKRIIEIGSGYSSCLVLDTNELFFENAIQCTFIDPLPHQFFALLHEDDHKQVRCIPHPVQDVDVHEFTGLTEHDMLLIDSTHVSKVNSDVNYIFFEILPRLKKGVYIHFHDIFYPFEYPEQWLLEGRAWNECYLLRAFLQYNTSFSIVLFTTFLEQFYESFFQQEMPLCLNNKGASLWIQKVT